jgi:hypothetical protein
MRGDFTAGVPVQKSKAEIEKLPKRGYRVTSQLPFRMSDLVMELCCALHNFRVRLIPWQPMV